MSDSGSEDIEQRLARLEQQDHQLARVLSQLAPQTPAAPRRRWDGYAAVIATLIGLLALVVSGYTAYVQRQQLRAQIWPHLMVGTSNVAPDVGVHVVNGGTGPARVITVRVTVDHKPVANWVRAKQAMGASPGGLVTSQLSGTVVPAGMNRMILRPFDDSVTDQFKELFLGKHDIDATICYCSVLDECWVVTSGTLPAAIAGPDACPITAAERFQQ